MSESTLNQLSIRGFDARIDKAIRVLARTKNISRNKAALILLQRGAGLEPDAPADAVVIGNSLDHFFGVWSPDQSQEFDNAVAPFEQVDAEMWR